VAEARRLRGTVMLEAPAGAWCAVVAAVDGTVELRVSKPRGLRGRRARRAELEALGYAPEHECYARRLPASAPDGEAAQALRSAVGEAALTRTLVQPGGDPFDLPPADAPHEEHVAAVLRALVRRRRGFAAIAGREVWACVWFAEPELVVEVYPPDDAGVEEHWTHPPDGSAAAIIAAIRRGRAQAEAEPLFLALMENPDVE
jgi:hypothetical protein